MKKLRPFGLLVTMIVLVFSITFIACSDSDGEPYEPLVIRGSVGGRSTELEISTNRTLARTVLTPASGDRYVLRYTDVTPVQVISQGNIQVSGIYITFNPSGGGESFYASFNGQTVNMAGIPGPGGTTLTFTHAGSGPEGEGSSSGGSRARQWSVPAALRGNWVTAQDIWTISANRITQESFGWGGFVGDIVNHRRIDNSSGYITLKITANTSGWGAGPGKFSVIYYEDITSSTGVLVQPLGNGEDTQAKAEAEITLENGSFDAYQGTHIVYDKLSGDKAVPANLRGTWEGDLYTLIITADYIVCIFDMMGMSYFIATIANVREGDAAEGPGTGYLTLYYVDSLNNALSPTHAASKGNYGMLYWQNHTGNTVDMVASGSTDASWGNMSRATAALAEAAFVFDVDDWEDLDLTGSGSEAEIDTFTRQ